MKDFGGLIKIYSKLGYRYLELFNNLLNHDHTLLIIVKDLRNK